MKITSQIFMVGGPNKSHMSDAAVYLVSVKGEAALIDAGSGQATDIILRNIRTAGVDPSKVGYLFLTHCHFDHTGGAEALRKACGCRIVAHDLDAEFLEAGDSHVTAASWYGTYMEPLRVDIRVTGKERTFQLGGTEIRYIHAPGHSPGSSVLTMESDGKLVLFGQDVHGPLNDTLRSVRKDYVASLEFLLSLDADILCEGHFGVFVGRDKVRDFIESYL